MDVGEEILKKILENIPDTISVLDCVEDIEFMKTMKSFKADKRSHGWDLKFGTYARRRYFVENEICGPNESYPVQWIFDVLEQNSYDRSLTNYGYLMISLIKTSYRFSNSVIKKKEFID